MSKIAYIVHPATRDSDVACFLCCLTYWLGLNNALEDRLSGININARWSFPTASHLMKFAAFGQRSIFHDRLVSDC